MKTEFELEDVMTTKGTISIIGTRPKNSPYVSIDITSKEPSVRTYIKDKDLERFAVNILKALKKYPIKWKRVAKKSKKQNQ